MGRQRHAVNLRSAGVKRQITTAAAQKGLLSDDLQQTCLPLLTFSVVVADCTRAATAESDTRSNTSHTAGSGPGRPPEDIIESIVVRGSSRIPEDTLRALMATKPGAEYSAEILHRDYMTLWNTGLPQRSALEARAR
jgi:hypothetical protein